MNDRFKFRVWKGQENRMVYEVTYLNPLLLDPRINKENVHNIPMQCTGLKDKNGKLIYEGDIVFNNCGQWIIKYCDKCKSFQCFDETYGCYSCLGDYSWAEFIEDLGQTTIEGNIYENKELLDAR